MQHRNTFKKEERLCSKIIIEQLFSEGKSLFSFPFKVIYYPVQQQLDVPVQIVFSVPKRNFKHAVKRNLLRRRMREAYRLHKCELFEKLETEGIQLALMFIFVDKEIQDYSVIEKGMVKALDKLSDKLVAHKHLKS